ncbi:MAG: hypothetical protein R2762_27150 [Bryobacteraceae bacterium]
MRRFAVPLFLIAAVLSAADLASVRSVYFMPMSNGLDQYLANRMTAEGMFTVVTDPKKADAVFTDQIGLSFEDRLAELLKVDEPPVEDKDGESKDKKKDEFDERQGKIGQGYAARFSTFSRGKGNVFLVDVKSHHVLWSVFQRPKQTTPEQLDKTSGQIVSQLKKASSPR